LSVNARHKEKKALELSSILDLVRQVDSDGIPLVSEEDMHASAAQKHPNAIFQFLIVGLLQ
jgi:hypothetical protein